MCSSDLNSKKLLSEDGLKYIHTLAKECAVVLAKVEPAIADAGLDRRDRKSKRKNGKRTSSNHNVEMDSSKLKLDEKEFLSKIEKARWSPSVPSIDDFRDYIDRLYEIQLHALLVFQVVTVGALSRDL